MTAAPLDPPESLTPPALHLLAGEALAPLEALQLVLRWRELDRLPRGDGHAVLLLPGFGAGDGSMRLLQHALRRLGYRAETWGQGRNLGMTRGIGLALGERLTTLSRHGATPVSLVGWSLGGVFARELARTHTAQVRGVITLGSPINVSPEANNLMPLFRLMRRGRDPVREREAFERRRTPPPVPCVAIFSRRDGIVAWPACCEDENLSVGVRNIEVSARHLALACNLEVIGCIAHSLARFSSNFPTDGKKMRPGY